MSTIDLQYKLLEKVVTRFPKRSVAVEALSTLLQIGKDGIYRRLRGESILTPKEITRIAQKFNISLDTLLFAESDQVIFSYSLFTHPVTSIQDYVQEVYEQASRVATLSNVQVHYAAQEIPVFLFYGSPEIFRLKVYIYAHTYWQLPAFRTTPFSFDLIPERIYETARQTANLYNTLPCEEIWRPSLLDNTLSQIRLLVNAGLFADPADSLVLLDALQTLLDHAKEMAEKGIKSTLGTSVDEKGAPYQLLYNEYASTNDTILLEAEQGALLFTSFGMPNFLKTSDERLLWQIRRWFRGLAANSTSLTRHDAKSRDRFFDDLAIKIRKTREQLLLVIEEMEGV